MFVISFKIIFQIYSIGYSYWLILMQVYYAINLET
jgi:hypothetical protein